MHALSMLEHSLQRRCRSVADHTAVLRPLWMACLAVGLAATAYRLTKLPMSAWTLAAVLCISCATRLQNDWRDRYHDLQKGKTFAWAYPKLFVVTVLSFWTVCTLLLATIALRNRTSALLLVAAAIAGLLYSETRRIPWAPILLSAIASASPAFLPSTLKPEVGRLLPLFAVAVLLIFGREILKDVEDKKFDAGYKWTIPLAYGCRAARWLATASVAGACVVAATISPLACVGILAAGAGLVLFWRDSAPATTMNCLDTGAALVIGALLIFPP